MASGRSQKGTGRDRGVQLPSSPAAGLDIPGRAAVGQLRRVWWWLVLLDLGPRSARSAGP